jgi:hypothetical protein
MAIPIRVIPGEGAPIKRPTQTRKPCFPENRTTVKNHIPKRSPWGARDFLQHYRQSIAALPTPAKTKPLSVYRDNLEEDERLVTTTLLPALASIRQHNPALDGRSALEAVRESAISAIDRLLASRK